MPSRSPNDVPPEATDNIEKAQISARSEADYRKAVGQFPGVDHFAGVLSEHAADDYEIERVAQAHGEDSESATEKMGTNLGILFTYGQEMISNQLDGNEVLAPNQRAFNHIADKFSGTPEAVLVSDVPNNGNLRLYVRLSDEVDLGVQLVAETTDGREPSIIEKWHVTPLKAKILGNSFSRTEELPSPDYEDEWDKVKTNIVRTREVTEEDVAHLEEYLSHVVYSTAEEADEAKA